MVTQRHSATTDRSLPAAQGRRTSASCSSQQAAAAWAWFEHGGSTFITPFKAEGLMAAKRSVKCNIAGLSRFKKELLPQQSDDASANGHPRQRHSFQDDDMAIRNSHKWRLSRSCRRAPHFSRDEGPDHLDAAEDDDGGFQVDEEPSSLLDKFEVDCLYRQLHDFLSSSGSTSHQLQEKYELTQKGHLHDHPGGAHIKRDAYFRSDDANKRLADTQHHQNINDLVLHRLLRPRIRSSRATSTALAFCRSVAIADSLVDHRRHRYYRHSDSPKHFIRGLVPLDQTSKQQEILYDRSSMRQNTQRVSIDGGEMKDLTTTNDQSCPHERCKFASGHRRSHHKMGAGSDLEQGGDAPPSRLHHLDFLYTKGLRPPMSDLPDKSALLCHNMDGAPSPDEHRVACTKRHRHFHKHHHIHHHHHHHLQHVHHAAQGTVFLDHLIRKNVDGAHVQKYPPKLHIEEIMTGPRDDRPIHDYIVAHNPPSRHRDTKISVSR